MPHQRICFAIALAAALPTLAGAADKNRALHDRVDEAIASSQFAAPAAIASDHEFIRRLFLDLIGRSPTVDEAKAFFSEDAADKRALLIDKLLLADEFNDNLAIVLDVMFMERRIGTRVPQQQWRDFLRSAVADAQPFDQIARSIITADGRGDARGAAKFLLQRDVEPNAVTRDVGRIFLGRDLQCAQCHDHPNVDDYLQSEYYGIYAFVNRSYLFEQQVNSPTASVGERAEGKTEFKSVFAAADDGTSQTIPRLLPGLTLDVEPRYEGEEAYVVTPTKSTAGVPKFSRRAQLARLITRSQNVQFARNAVNRFWAHMLGHGLVDPVDFHHGDNPPSHPELLEILATEFVAMGFDIRELLRQIALSETYQRSIDFPLKSKAAAEQLKTARQQISTETKEQKAQLVGIRAERAEFAARLENQRSQLARVDSVVTTAANQFADLIKQDQQLKKASVDLQKRLKRTKQQAAALAAAESAAKRVLGLFPKDKGVATTHAGFKQRAAKLASEVETIQKSIASKPAEVKALAAKLKVGGIELAKLRAKRIGSADMVAEARGALSVFDRRQREHETLLEEQSQRMATLNLHEDYLAKSRSRQQLADLVAKTETDLLAADDPKLDLAIATAEREVAQQRGILESSQQEMTATEGALTRQVTALDALKTAIAQAKSAAGDLAVPTLSAAVEALATQRATLSDRLEAARGEVQEKAAQFDAARNELKRRIATQEDLTAKRAAILEQQEPLRKQLLAAQESLRGAIVEEDMAAAEVRESWERRFVIRTLKPLGPEQLAGSTLAALNLKPRFQREAEAEWEKKNKKGDQGPGKVTKSAEQKQTEIAALAKKRIDQVTTTFVSLFAAPAASPQDVFSSTADQALFFANDGRVQSWLRPSEGTLTRRLQALKNADELADELHLAILSRPASRAEKERISNYLAERKEDRNKAINELAWGLLSSVEFRFNH